MTVIFSTASSGDVFTGSTAQHRIGECVQLIAVRRATRKPFDAFAVRGTDREAMEQLRQHGIEYP